MLDDLVNIDPTLQSIEEKRKIGLWPPSKDNIADSIYPYIKRMKKEKVQVLVVGVELGEIAYRLLELDTSKKIARVTGIVTSNESDLTKEKAIRNLRGTRSSVVSDTNDKFDVVIINNETLANIRGPHNSLDMLMDMYYNQLEIGGIFCGNNHDKTHIKEDLVKFRRKNKIGTPILVSNRVCFFWYKR